MGAKELLLIFLSVTNRFDLPKDLLSSICFVESSYKVTAKHKDDGQGDSLGVCQTKLNTARLMHFRGTERELMNPKVNAFYAGKYLSWQLHRYKGDVIKAVAAYNSGTYRQSKTGAAVNSKYVLKVMDKWSKIGETRSYEVSKSGSIP